MYLPAIVMVGHYFEKKRAFATGVAVSGAGIGGFVFAPVCEKLLHYYGWKGATLIIAGVTLNGIVIGALFRPLEPTIMRVKKKRSDLVKHSDNGHLPDQTEVPQSLEIKSDMLNAHPAKRTDISPEALLHAKIKRNLDQDVHKDENGLAMNGCSDRKEYTMQSMQNLCAPETALKCRSFYKSADDILLNNGYTSKESAKKVDMSYKPLFRKDIFYSGSIRNLPEYQSQTQVSYRQSVTSIPKDDSSSQRAGCAASCRSMLAPMTSMMDFSLLLNPVFAIYGFSCFLCMAGDYFSENVLVRKRKQVCYSLVKMHNYYYLV